MANDTKTFLQFITDMFSTMDDDDEVKKKEFIPGLGDAINFGQTEEVKYNRATPVPPVASQSQTTLKPVAITVPPINRVPPVSGYLSGEGDPSGVPTELPNVPVPKKGPSFLDKALASAGFSNNIDSAEDLGESAAQTGSVLKAGVATAGDVAVNLAEGIADPVTRFYQGATGKEATGIPDGSFGRFSKNEKDRLSIGRGPADLSMQSESEIPVLPGQEVVLAKEIETPEVPVDTTAAALIPDTQTVSTTEVEPTDAEATVPTAVTEEVDKKLAASDIGGAGNKTPKVPLQEAKEDPTFFGKLWDSVKDIAKQGFEDPALRKALFAYTASKVLGGDGVSFGAAVLENEWKVQAAKAKADSDQAIASGKVKATASAKLATDLSPDFGSGVTLFDNSTRQEVKGVKSKDNSRFFPSNVAPFLSIDPDLKPGGSVPMSALIGSNAFAFDGETQDGAIQRLVVEAQTTAESAVNKITLSLASNSDMKEGEKTLLIDQLNNSTERNNLIQSVSSFVNGFPANTDFITNKSVVEGMITRGMQDWVNTVAKGGAKNNKDIASFLDFQKLKYDITDKGIPSSFFEVIGKPKEEIGQNAWAKVRTNAKTFNSVLNAKLKKNGLAQSDFTNGNVYKHLHRAYSNAMLTGRKGIKEHWESRSEASSDNKAEQLSPALLWVNSMFTKSKSETQYLAGSPSDVANSIVESIQNAKALLTKKQEKGRI